MAAPPNVYHHRRVADASAKPCMICYKPATSVLATPDSRDFFYTCPGHLSDRGFAIPLGADGKEIKLEDEAARRRKEELERQIEQVKKEYEEKVKKRRDKKKKSKDKDKDKDKDKSKDDDDEADKKDEKEKEDKIKELEKENGAGAPAAAAAPRDPGSRIFALHKNVYQMRVARLQQAAAAKRRHEQQERLRGMQFPAVPKGDLKPPGP